MWLIKQNTIYLKMSLFSIYDETRYHKSKRKFIIFWKLIVIPNHSHDANCVTRDIGKNLPKVVPKFLDRNIFSGKLALIQAISTTQSPPFFTRRDSHLLMISIIYIVMDIWFGSSSFFYYSLLEFQ